MRLSSPHAPQTLYHAARQNTAAHDAKTMRRCQNATARAITHGGASRGAQSRLLVFPDHDMAIAFNINSRTEEFREFGSFYEDIFREFALAGGGE